MKILLTNDDGIESAGLRALYDVLADRWDVTAVAPAEDKSAVGRAISNEATVETHELGYVLDGTPADCVVAGLEALTPAADLVVSGCNRGANLGAYTLGRSGTISAAVEATFFGLPALAVSLYIPVDEDVTWSEVAVETDSYREAARATRYLVEHAETEGVFERADYLNINAPMPDGVGQRQMEATRPSLTYDMTAAHEDGRVRLTDRIWTRMAEGDVPDPDGTDRRAIVEGRVSVSPLTAPHTVEHHDQLEALARQYPSEQ